VSKRKRVACDFDGVLYDYHGGSWIGPKVFHLNPHEGAIEWLADLYQCYDIVIYTCRFTRQLGPGFPRQSEADVFEVVINMKKWFHKHGLPIQVLANLVFWTDSGKPHAILYLDDRGCRFVGAFPPPESIAAMFPWSNT